MNFDWKSFDVLWSRASTDLAMAIDEEAKPSERERFDHFLDDYEHCSHEIENALSDIGQAYMDLFKAADKMEKFLLNNMPIGDHVRAGEQELMDDALALITSEKERRARVNSLARWLRLERRKLGDLSDRELIIKEEAE